jgi:hypothetical protein
MSQPSELSRSEGRTYSVNLYDCCGDAGGICKLTFDEALKAYADYRARSDRRQVVELHNDDNIDLGCADGLTEDERELVEACK